MKKAMISAALAVLMASGGAHAEIYQGNLTGNPENAAFETCIEGKRKLLKLTMTEEHWKRLAPDNELMFIQSLPTLDEQRQYRNNNMHRLSIMVQGKAKLGDGVHSLYNGQLNVDKLLMAGGHKGVIKRCSVAENGLASSH